MGDRKEDDTWIVSRGFSEAWQLHCCVLKNLCRNITAKCVPEDRKALYARIQSVAGLLMASESGKDADVRNAALDTVLAHSELQPHQKICSTNAPSLMSQAKEHFRSIVHEARMAVELTTTLSKATLSDKNVLHMLYKFVAACGQVMQEKAATADLYATLNTFLVAVYQAAPYAGNEQLLDKIVVAHRGIVQGQVHETFRQQHELLLDSLLQCPFSRYSLDTPKASAEPAKVEKEEPPKKSRLSATSASFEPGSFVFQAPQPTSHIAAAAVTTSSMIGSSRNASITSTATLESAAASASEEVPTQQESIDNNDEEDLDKDDSEDSEEEEEEGNISDISGVEKFSDDEADGDSKPVSMSDSANLAYGSDDSFDDDVFETAGNSPVESPNPSPQPTEQPQHEIRAEPQEEKRPEPTVDEKLRNAQDTNETESEGLPLKNPWTLWGAITAERYAEAVKPVGDTFDTVQGFWALMQQHVPPPRTWKNDAMFHLFRGTIQPLNETPELAQGGSFDIEPPKGDVEGFEMIWSNVILGVIGGVLDKATKGTDDEIMGVVWQRKPRVFGQLTIWTKNAKRCNSTMKSVVQILKQLVPGVPISLGRFKTFKR